MKKISALAPILLGVNAILAQVILIRELLVSFSGNELSMGIMLAAWLIGGAIGSLILARLLIDRVKEPEHIYSIALITISVIMPSTIALSRAARVLFGIHIYEAIGPLQIFNICMLLLLPISCILSLMFMLCCKMLKSSISKASAAATAYVLESIGAALAGAAFTFILVKYIGPFQLISAVIIINFSFLLWSSLITKKNRLIFFLLLVIAIAVSALGLPRFLEKKSQGLQWHPQKVLAYKNSPYGNIAVTRQAESTNIYENGSLIFSSHDTAFKEEFSHIVMLQHANP
ncbi:MAG: hypothetical protein ABH843_07505, partial [Candidatus Omnitrophota bacterium]